MAVDKMQELIRERIKVYGEMSELRERGRSEWDGDDLKKWDRLDDRFDELSEEIERTDQEAKEDAKESHRRELMEREQHQLRSEVGKDRHRRGVQTRTEPFHEQEKLDLMQAVLRRSQGTLMLRNRDLEVLSLVDSRQSELKRAEESYNDAEDRELRRGGDLLMFMARHQPYNYLQGAKRYSDPYGNTVPFQPDLVREGFQQRDLNITTATEGPEMIPQGFMNTLEKYLLQFGGMRALARIMSTASGNSIPWPTFDDTGNTGQLLAEAASIGASVDPVTGSVELLAHKYSSRPVLVAEELLEDAAFNLAVELAMGLAIRIGRATGTHYVSGTGSGQPQGAVTGATAGVTAASATAIVAEELLQLQDSLDENYSGMTSVAWAMNKTTRSEVRQLEFAGASGRFLWQPGLQAGVPELLLGKPIGLVHEMANIATTTVPVLYGAWEKVIIRDAGQSRFYRLNELYRANDQTGFVMLSRHDQKVLNGNAIKKLTMA